MKHVISIEATPNPDAKKFVVDSPLGDGGTRSFESAEVGQADPLARALFAIDGVMSVFYMGRFVTVNKRPGIAWDALEPCLARTIEEHSERVSASTDGNQSEPSVTPDALLAKINSVLDATIRPALAGDGGGLQVLGLDGHTLKIHYQGACGSCPSSTAGTMMAIQNLLRQEVDPKIKVVPA